jgi:hypothetical protein
MAAATAQNGGNRSRRTTATKRKAYRPLLFQKKRLSEPYRAGGTDPSSSMTFAVSFDHSCSPPQCGQPIRPTNDGSLANEDFSISIPVSIIRPVTLHGVQIFHIGAPSPRPANRTL